MGQRATNYMSNTPRIKRGGLAYYIHDGPAVFRFQLSGEVAGAAVRDLEQTWRTASSAFGGRRLVVDLSSVTGIDHAGREMLDKWQGEGACIVVSSAAAKDRIESMTDVPVTLLGLSPKPYTWPLFRVAPRWMAAFLVLLYPATGATVSQCATDSTSAASHGPSASPANAAQDLQHAAALPIS
jgi:hypothetical protein